MKYLKFNLKDKEAETNFNIVQQAIEYIETWPGWDDLPFPFTRDKQGQAAKPDFDFTDLGLLFPQNDPAEIVYLIGQFRHSRENGSDIHAHLHYWQDEADEPVFKMDYRWVKNGSDPTVAYTTLIASKFVFTYVSGTILQKALFPVIDGSAIDTVSSMMDIKFYRDDNVVAGDVLVKEFDIHFKRNTLGSRQEFVK